MGHEWDVSDKSGIMLDMSGKSGIWVGHEWDMSGTCQAIVGHIGQKWDNARHKWDKWNMGGTCGT